MTKVIFICHGNICRSTMAEFMMKDMVRRAGHEGQFHIESAATSREEIGNDTHPGTKRKLDEAGISYTRHRARQVTKADYEAFDYLIVMDQANLRDLKRMIGGDPQHKVYKLMEFAGTDRDIADPWYTGNFDHTYDDIAAGLKGLTAKLFG